MYGKLFAHCRVWLGKMPGRNITVGLFSAPALSWRSVRLFGLIAVVILVTIMAGQVGDGYLSADTLMRANVIYRQAVAVSDLDEKALMIDIIDRLGAGLEDGDRAQIGPIIVDEARRYGFDPLLLVALIMTESSFGPTEVSYMGARGLMQVKPSVAKAVALRNGLGWRHADQLFDPAYNVRLGTQYLFELVVQFRDVKKALIAYNYGETALRWRIRTGQKLPTAYFRRVRNNYCALRERFGEDAPWEAVQFDLPFE